MNLRFALALTIAACANCSVSATPGEAKVSLPAVFSSGMVLQRDQKIHVWGRASCGEAVRVEINGQNKSTTADSSGNWQMDLMPEKAASDRTITVTGLNKIVLKDVMIGDVWICSGQSNMNFPLGASDFQGDPLPSALTARVRTFSTLPAPPPGSTTSTTSTQNGWAVPTQQSSLALPAIPFLFARTLASEEHIPIGIIMAACDGAPLETFMPDETAEKMHCKDRLLCAPHKVGENFRALLMPILPFRTRGIIWYQGESNLFNIAAYRTEFPAFIQDLRARLKAPLLPFIFVQLPNYGFRQPDHAPTDSFWADMREAQKEACHLPNVHMVVSVDTAAAGSSSLHPREKTVISTRLASLAKAVVEGQVPVVPAIESQRIEDDALILTMKNIRGKLATRNGDKPTGFQLAGADKKFYWADAEISGNQIKVTCDEVVDPVAVRYAWADNPACNLYCADLPMTPFRTDSWMTRPKLNPAAAPRMLSVR